MKYRSNVVTGHGRGKGLGFPTFNLVVPDQFDFEFGVYSASVWIDEVRYLGALHYGPVPTFDETAPTLEIFVLDYDQDIPIESLQFEIIHRIRDIMRFDSVKELHDRIEQDVAEVRTIRPLSNLT